MVCLGNMCMATLHKGDDDAIIIIIIIIITATFQTSRRYHISIIQQYNTNKLEKNDQL